MGVVVVVSFFGVFLTISVWNSTEIEVVKQQNGLYISPKEKQLYYWRTIFFWLIPRDTPTWILFEKEHQLQRMLDVWTTGPPTNQPTNKQTNPPTLQRNQPTKDTKNQTKQSLSFWSDVRHWESQFRYQLAELVPKYERLTKNLGVFWVEHL